MTRFWLSDRKLLSDIYSPLHAIDILHPHRHDRPQFRPLNEKAYRLLDRRPG